MEGEAPAQPRRWRRRGRGQTILPLRSSRLSNTISSCYCDLKIQSLNEPLYLFGQKHARFLRAWFTMGIGFSLSVLFGVAVVLFWESVATLFLPYGSKISDLFSSLLFGLNPTVFIFKMSVLDVGYFLASTIISVAVHEFGHAVAAASKVLTFSILGTALMGSSEGIQLEYIAIFLAVLFPGALVAFNYELPQTKPHSAALRIYCAGIWHNAVVLDVSSSSPLYGYLSPGEVILTVNGIKIRNSQEWLEMAILLKKQTLASTEVMQGFQRINERMVYCAPSSLLQRSESMLFMGNQSSCPQGKIAFVSIPCSDFSVQLADHHEFDVQKIEDNGYCLSYADLTKLNKCGSPRTTTDSSGDCICSENELCLSPVQMHGIAWAEIAYRRPYSRECMKLEKNITEPSENSVSGEDCYKTFLYVGDMISMARSVRLTSFQPHFPSMFGASIPDMLERIFACTFQVSVALVLLNSLPVYFLDGEAILEVCSFYITSVSPMKRRLCLQACFFGGSIVSCLLFLKALLIRFW